MRATSGKPTRGSVDRIKDPAFSLSRVAVSRRELARGGLAAALAGAGTAPAIAAKKPAINWTFAPVPIPGATPALGGHYHLFGPSLIDPQDAEPATITNFQGVVGLALINGMVTQTNTRTGEQQQLPFLDTDMRFMKGTFVGTDGKTQQGTFAFL